MTEDEIKAIKAQIDESASYRLWRLENNPSLIKGNFDANQRVGWDSRKIPQKQV
ncbi:hypothetical protein HG534_10830 [Moraxella osloensis]|nr:hypothetical protein [Moraxella osloensis]MBW4016785.1 hypothetical protein [Moraxella osloensis]MBW4019181.1 hypothetical protein [Moraxella osloensis]